MEMCWVKSFSTHGRTTEQLEKDTLLNIIIYHLYGMVLRLDNFTIDLKSPN